MNWLVNLFTSHSIAGAVVILALTIAIGMMLNKIKFGSVSLGVEVWLSFPQPVSEPQNSSAP